MKIITEAEYQKLDKAAQDELHKKVREQLIEVGLIKPNEEPTQNAPKRR